MGMSVKLEDTHCFFCHEPLIRFITISIMTSDKCSLSYAWKHYWKLFQMSLCYCCHIAVNVCECLQVIRNYSLSLWWIVWDTFFIVYLNTTDVTECFGCLRLYMQWTCHAWDQDKRDTLCFKRIVKRLLKHKEEARIQVFWDVMLCHTVCVFRCLEGSWDCL
jgi:hypothetical protein